MNINSKTRWKHRLFVAAALILVCIFMESAAGSGTESAAGSGTAVTGRSSIGRFDSVGIDFTPYQAPAAYGGSKTPGVMQYKAAHDVAGGTLTFYYLKNEHSNFYCEWSDGSAVAVLCFDYFTYHYFDGNMFKVSEFADILGESGFKITWCNKFNKPHTEYYIYENGLPRLYFSGDYVTETDIDSDGDAEVITMGHNNTSARLYDRRGGQICVGDIESAAEFYSGVSPLSTFYMDGGGYIEGCFVFEANKPKSDYSYTTLYAVYSNGRLYFTDKAAVTSEAAAASLLSGVPAPAKEENTVPLMTESEKYDFAVSKLDAAYEAYFWFHGDTLPLAVPGVRLSDEGGGGYNKIESGRFPDYDSFAAYIASLFSPEITAPLLSGGLSQPRYINHDGELWGIDATGGRRYNLTYGGTDYYVVSSSDTEIVIKGVMSRMRDVTGKNSKHIELDLDYREQYGYKLQYLNGAWVFEEFENYEGRIENGDAAPLAEAVREESWTLDYDAASAMLVLECSDGRSFKYGDYRRTDINSPYGLSFDASRGASDVRLVTGGCGYAALIYPVRRYVFDEAYAEAAVIIRLSDGHIKQRYGPSENTFLDCFDATGSIAEQLAPYLSDGKNPPRYGIYCEASPRDGGFGVAFRLAACDGSVRMDGVYYFSAGSPASVNGQFYTVRAVTDIDAMDFVRYYDRAYEAAYWFEAVESLQTEASGTGGGTEWNGARYNKIADSRFNGLGIKTLADLEKYLKTVFTPDIVSALMSRCAGGGYECGSGRAQIAEFGGALWAADSSRIFNASMMRDPEYFLSGLDGGSASLVCRVYQYEGGKPSRTGTPTDYEYTFVKRDGKWLCSGFPLIW